MTLEDWKARALSAEANFNRLKEKVIGLVDRISKQRETVEAQVPFRFLCFCFDSFKYRPMLLFLSFIILS